MNCKQANQLPIQKVIEYFTKTDSLIVKGDDLWYKSPFRSDEKTPSFKINVVTNRWYDFGKTGKPGGTVIDFITEFRNCSISEALALIGTFSDSSHEQVLLSSLTKQVRTKTSFSNQQTPTKQFNSHSSSTFEILKITSLKNDMLLNYVKSRKIDVAIARHYLKEIYFKNIRNNKTYFALCFFNDKNGYEWRNKYMGGVIGSKGVTHLRIGQNSSIIAVFEGSFDFLTHCTIRGEKHTESDYLILNSVAMIGEGIRILETGNYTNTYLYLDNDTAGDEATLEFIKLKPIITKDRRNIFKNYKDYNEFWCN